MKQIKMIYADWLNDKRLDDNVNEWIKEMGDSVSIIDIRVNITGLGQSVMPHREAYIIYEKKEENNDEIRP